MDVKNADKNTVGNFEHVIDHLSEGVIVVNKDGIVRVFNKEAAEMFDIKKNDALGKNIRKVLPTSCLNNIIHTGESYNNFKFKYKNMAVLSNSNPILKEGALEGAFAIFKDITMIENVTSELQTTKELYSHLQKRMYNTKMISNSAETKQILDTISRIARTNVTVLLQGETGVGKGLIAKEIHKLSPRSHKPFVEINCASLSPSLLEAEIFGYEEGSFTGAKKQGKPGLLEIAISGTVFLDEIGELPLDLQAKILHAIDEKKITRVGGVKSKDLDIRIISATNVPLLEMVKLNKFRDDLFYRLNVIPINIPPLRERKNDIQPLILLFLDSYNTEYNLDKRIDNKLMSFLTEYPWPGNIREVKNVVQRLVLLSDYQIININSLPYELKSKINAPHAPLESGNTHFNNIVNDTTDENIPLRTRLENYEKIIIKEALSYCGNIQNAAETLCVDRSTIFRKAKKYDLL